MPASPPLGPPPPLAIAPIPGAEPDWVPCVNPGCPPELPGDIELVDGDRLLPLEPCGTNDGSEPMMARSNGARRMASALRRWITLILPGVSAGLSICAIRFFASCSRCGLGARMIRE